MSLEVKGRFMDPPIIDQFSIKRVYPRVDWYHDSGSMDTVCECMLGNLEVLESGDVRWIKT